MNKGHMLCALLPLVVAVPDIHPSAYGTPPPAISTVWIADNQLEGMCRTLVLRVREEIHAGALLVDRLGSALGVSKE